MANEPTAIDATRHLAEYWRALGDSGWLDDTPEEEIPQLRARLEAAYGENPANTHLGLAKATFTDWWLTGEPAPTEGALPVCLRRLGESSCGGLRFEALPRLPGARDELRFRLNGIAEPLVLGSRWWLERCAGAINERLEGTAEHRRLHFLPAGADDQTRPVFVRPETLAQAMASGVIPVLPQRCRAPLRMSGGLRHIRSGKVAGAGTLAGRLVKGARALYAAADRVEVIKVLLPDLERAWGSPIEPFEEPLDEVDGVLIVSTVLRGGVVRGLDGATGEPLWKRSGYAAVAAGFTYVGSSNGVEVVDVRTGVSTFTLRPTVPHGPIRVVGRTAERLLCFEPAESTLIRAVDWQTGQTDWEVDIGPLLRSVGVEDAQSWFQLHELDGWHQVVFAGTRALCLEVLSEHPWLRESWRTEVAAPLCRRPAVHGRRIYSARRDWISAIDCHSGQVIFDREHEALEHAEHWTRAIPFVDQVLVPAPRGLAFFDALDGSLNACYPPWLGVPAVLEREIAVAVDKSIRTYQWR